MWFQFPLRRASGHYKLKFAYAPWNLSFATVNITLDVTGSNHKGAPPSRLANRGRPTTAAPWVGHAADSLYGAAKIPPFLPPKQACYEQKRRRHASPLTPRRVRDPETGCGATGRACSCRAREERTLPLSGTEEAAAQRNAPTAGPMPAGETPEAVSIRRK